MSELLGAMRARAHELERKGPRCTVWSILDKLDAADRAQLDEALADDAIPSRAIAEVLTAAGHRLSQHTVNRHRRKDCSCGAR